MTKNFIHIWFKHSFNRTLVVLKLGHVSRSTFG